MYLIENNKVFGHIVDTLDLQSNQFFNEFFAIYKTVTVSLK